MQLKIFFFTSQRMQTTIAARSKLRQQFEQSIPATTTYIIGCLQYKSSNDVTDYHYRVLDLLDAVIQNTPQKVISQFRIFDKGIM